MIEKQRVAKDIAPAIIQFCKNRIASGQHQFRMQDLLAYVRVMAGPAAPDSPSRILRDLRDTGKLYYLVVNRRRSLYRIMQVV